MAPTTLVLAASASSSGTLLRPLSTGYPKGVIQHYSTPTTIRPVDLQAARGPGVTLPYVRSVSEAIRRILTPLGVKVSFRPNVTLHVRQLLVRPKDRILESEATGVVYQVPCASCPATYVGQTGRRLDQRLQEHRRAVESAVSSALAEHAWSCHHPVDWDNTRILDHHHHLHQRLILVHIRSQPKPLTETMAQCLRCITHYSKFPPPNCKDSSGF